MSAPVQAQINAETLLAVDLFRDLNDKDRAAIAARCEGSRFSAGSKIVLQEDNRTDVFLIISGQVRVIFNSKLGKEVQFRDQNAGECFGELSAIDGEPRSAEVNTLTDVFVGTIKSADFLDIATNYPSVSAKLLHQLTYMVRSLTDRVVELSTLGVANRFHAELLRLARSHGVINNKSLIKPAPTHAEFASRVSTQREAITKEIGRLVRHDILERTRGGLNIPDVVRLETMVKRLVDI
jgi:CRP/FNR family cyclic AMP-dependent transcriptional regulator